jgi:hypothetical protein
MSLLWEPYSEHGLVEALRATLVTLPNVAVREVRENVRLRTNTGGAMDADAIFNIDLRGTPATLLVEAKNSVYPRDAREAAWQLRKLQGALQEAEGFTETLPVIASRSLSAGARDFLRSENIGYYEEGGSLFLFSPLLYIFVDRPPSKRAAQVRRALFSGRRSQVLLALLQHSHEWHSVKDLAAVAFASPATVSQVLVELEKREWVATRGGGPHKERQLADPRSVLDAWAKHIADLPKQQSRRFFVPSLKPEELLQRVHRVCEARSIPYEITGEWAAQIYSPFLSSISQVRCRVHTDHAATLVGELQAREVSEGSNFALLEAKSRHDFLFREQERGVWLANPIIVYLDLLRSGGRAKELAQHLREERIHF